MSRVQDDGNFEAGRAPTAQLERAREAARAFCRQFKFPQADIDRLDGQPIQQPLVIDRDGARVEVFRWLGHGRGAHYVQVELGAESGDLTVYGAHRDQEFGPWKP